MKYILLISLIFAVLSAEEIPIENNVRVLTNKTFDEAITKYEHILVLFYAPWCGHCKKLHPEYEKAAETLNKENLYLAKIDATENREIASKFKIQGYPTLYFFVKGEAIEYNGGRKEKGIIDWVRKKSKSATTEVASKDDLEKLKKDNDVVAVFFGDDEKKIKVFNVAALKNDGIPFVIVKSADLAKENKAEKDSLVLFKKFDELRNEIKDLSSDKLEEFFNKYSVPKVMKFNERTGEIIFGKNVPGLFLFADEKNKEKWEEFNKMLLTIYEKKGDKLRVLLNDIEDSFTKRFADYLGVKKEQLPCVFLMDTRRRQKKYRMEGDVTAENLNKFIEDWEADKLSVDMKSQAVPKENNGDIYVLVAKTFKQEVIENDKDVMVLFYAPWCGHCKAFHPKYEEVARKLKKDNPKLLLAKIDMTENEIESVRIKGYPTIKFYPGNKKKEEPKDYDGKRDVEDVIEFIKKNAYNKIEYVSEKKEEKKEEKKDEKKEEKKEEDL